MQRPRSITLRRKVRSPMSQFLRPDTIPGCLSVIILGTLLWFIIAVFLNWVQG